MNPTPSPSPSSPSKPAPGPSKDIPGLTYRPRDARDAVTQRWTRRERKNLYGK